jgi:hypothetical protein
MVGEVAVALGVGDVLAEMQDAPVEVIRFAPPDFRGAFPVDPVLVEALGS